MSCIDCEKIQKDNTIAYFRWGKANIAVMGCDKHLREVFTILRENIYKADWPYNQTLPDNYPIYRIKKN